VRQALLPFSGIEMAPHLRWSRSASVVRTFVLATIAVPIVIYGLMPHLHRIRTQLLVGRATQAD
jgi:hypothetical protein